MWGKMKTPKNANTYIRGFCNILINILFITILIAIGLCIYKLIYFILKTIPNISTLYGNLISASVTIILALISYIAKMKKYIPILLHKFKQRIYQFFAWRYNPFSAFVITDYNKFNLLETEEQGKFISSAIHVLKSNTQNMILFPVTLGKARQLRLCFYLVQLHVIKNCIGYFRNYRIILYILIVWTINPLCWIIWGIRESKSVNSSLWTIYKNIQFHL